MGLFAGLLDDGRDEAGVATLEIPSLFGLSMLHCVWIVEEMLAHDKQCLGDVLPDDLRTVTSWHSWENLYMSWRCSTKPRVSHGRTRQWRRQTRRGNKDLKR